MSLVATIGKTNGKSEFTLSLKNAVNISKLSTIWKERKEQTLNDILSIMFS